MNIIDNHSIKKQRDIAHQAMSLLLFSLLVLRYARAIPILIPPMAISMQKSINMIRMIIFVDFFIFLLPFGTSITQEICQFYPNLC